MFGVDIRQEFAGFAYFGVGFVICDLRLWLLEFSTFRFAWFKLVDV